MEQIKGARRGKSRGRAGVRKKTRTVKGSLGEKRSSNEEAHMPLCTFARLLPAYLFNLFPQDITDRRTNNHHTCHVCVSVSERGRVRAI